MKIGLLSIILMVPVCAQAGVRVALEQVRTDSLIGNGNNAAVQLETDLFHVRSLTMSLDIRKEGFSSLYDGYGFGLDVSKAWRLNDRNRLITRIGARMVIPSEQYSYFTYAEDAGHRVIFQRSVHVSYAMNVPILRADPDARNSTVLGYTPGIFLERRVVKRLRVRAGVEIFLAPFATQEAKWDEVSGRLATTVDHRSFRVVFLPTLSLGF